MHQTHTDGELGLTNLSDGLLLPALHRAPGALLVCRQDDGAVIGDGNGVLVVRRGQPIVGDDCPAVGQGVAPVGAKGDHRLDGDDHAGLQTDAAAATAVVADLGVLVHDAADAVSDVVADHAVAVGLGELLDRRADVAEAVAGDGLLDGGLEAVEGALAQRLPLARQGSDVEGPGVVADPAAIGRARVDGMPWTICSLTDEQMLAGKPP